MTATGHQSHPLHHTFSFLIAPAHVSANGVCQPCWACLLLRVELACSEEAQQTLLRLCEGFCYEVTVAAEAAVVPDGTWADAAAAMEGSTA